MSRRIFSFFLFSDGIYSTNCDDGEDGCAAYLCCVKRRLCTAGISNIDIYDFPSTKLYGLMPRKIPSFLREPHGGRLTLFLLVTGSRLAIL